jgi:uncharacterized protein (TIGR03790 family)
MRGLFWFLLLSAGLLRPVLAPAGLAAHEVLLLVNARSARSLEVANHFVQLRRIPARNVVYLELPDAVLAPAAQISPDDFTRYIWEPARAAVLERDIDAQVLAWVYSVDFPVRVSTDPVTSLTGLTFLKNRVPEDPTILDRGRYLSPLFAGPDAPGGHQISGGSLIRMREVLGDQMPVPAMMLGFCGARGNDVDAVLASLRRGQASDRSAPRGTVYWIEGEDIRARMRNWQFASAQAELTELSVRADISTDLPAALPGIIGLQMGLADVQPDRAGSFLPGAMAEHVTSHGAEFDKPIHTKITEWIRAGATATAGTVVEPYANWSKFPNARFFPHYARGHTLLESFYLSLLSPGQLLLLGEPLARPWAPRFALTLISMEDNPLKGEAAFVAAMMPEMQEGLIGYRVVMNGEALPTSSTSPSFSFDTADLDDGYHELRVVAHMRNIITHSVMSRLDIEVANKDRFVRIEAPVAHAELDGTTPFSVRIDVAGEPERVEWLHNLRVLDAAPDGERTWRIDPRALGAGPVQLHARAVYDDGMNVLSPPLPLTIQRPGPALPPMTDRTHWIPDADSSPLRPEDGAVAHAMRAEPVSGLNRYAAVLTIPGGTAAQDAQSVAGLVFDYQDAANYRFFAWHGAPSAWSFGTVEDGQVRHQLQRGAPLLRGAAREIELLFDAAGVTAYVQGTAIATWPGQAHADGRRIGIMAAGRPAFFEHIQFAGVKNEENE